MIIPYFEIESHPDGIDALMTIDQELAAANPVFGRTFFPFETTPGMVAGKRDGGVNVTVVKRIRSDIRVRRWLRVMWTDDSKKREAVLVPDDLFTDIPDRIKEMIDDPANSL